MIISHEFRSLAEWDSWSESDPSSSSRKALERAILATWTRTREEVFLIPGFCIACGKASIFELDERYGPQERSVPGWEPNWRERLQCNNCGLNNRTRAVLSVALPVLEGLNGTIWLAEQTTPLYGHLNRRYPTLVGSEFLRGDFASGQVLESGLRHEDATATSFNDRSLAAALSFDVLEHIPDFRRALIETHRVLAEGGWMIWTAPFRIDCEETLVRAVVRKDSTIEYCCPPEFHGDPVNPEEGILCFQHFGWEILEELKDVGFRDAYVRTYWSDETANLGPLQTVFLARK